MWDTRNPSLAFTHSTFSVFTPDMAYHHWHANGLGIVVTTDIPATRSLKPLSSRSKSQHSNWVSLGVERERHEGSIGGLRRQEFNGGTHDLGHRNRGSSSSHTHMRFTLPWTHLFEKSVLGSSQIHLPGSVAGGVIFIWPFSKPRSPLRSYTIEAIGPISSTNDGIYLAGGAISGNLYIWEVISGKLLKTWHAHNSPITCLAFSNDASLLRSGSEDGMIVVWPMISLPDDKNLESSNLSLSVSTEHKSFITGLLPSSSVSQSVFVSSSLDGTCKVWDLVNGTLLQTWSFPQPITATVLDPLERFLFSGRIFMTPFDVGLMKEPSFDTEDQKLELNGHKESITALNFCKSGLISASEDCTACLWNVIEGVIIRRFNHHKGFITNMVAIPHSSLLPSPHHQRKFTNLPVSLLQKYPQQDYPSNSSITLLLPSSSTQQQITHQYQSANLLKQQILDLEVKRTPEALQLKVETNIENRLWITNMTKHVIEMNNHLQSRLLDLTQLRLLQDETHPKSNTTHKS